MPAIGIIKYNIIQDHNRNIEGGFTKDMKEYHFLKEDTLCVKAIAVMLMLTHHLFAFPDKLHDGAEYVGIFTMSDGQSLAMLLGNFGKLCVALFMMLSGFGIYRSYMLKERKDSETMTGIIIKRIRNSYIKYWQILIIFAPMGLIIGAENITKECTPVDWVKNFLAIDTKFNSEAWFLTMYLLTLCLLPLIIRWFERKNANPWADAVWIMLFNVVVITVLSSFVDNTELMRSFSGTYYYQKLRTVLSMLAMFMAGCYLAKYEIIEKIRNKFDFGYVAKIVGVIIIAVVFLLRENWAMRTEWGWDRLDFVYAAAFTIAVALIIDGLTHVKRILGFVGKYATGIWLTHSFFCYYYCQKLIYAPKNTILIFIFLLGLSLFVAWGLDTLYSVIWKYTRILFVNEEEQ